MEFERAYFTIIAVTHLGFAAIFLFLHLHRRSKFLEYFALAWAIEAIRISLLVAEARGMHFSDRWFALQDIFYLVVTWLLFSASAHVVGVRLSRRWPAAYFCLSIPLILVNYYVFRPAFVRTPGWESQPGLFEAVFYPLFVNLVLVFVPGAVARVCAMVWLFRYWERTRLPGAVIASLFFLLHGLGSLSVPVQFYFSYYPSDSYLTWFLEILGLSVGIVMLALNRQHAELVLAERKYALFFERLVEAALLFDERERCVAVNPVAQSRLGLDGAVNLALEDLFVEEEAYAAFRDNVFRRDFVKVETNLRSSGGGTFLASVSGGTHYGVDRRLSGFFVTFEDITERRRAEEEINRLLILEQQARGEAEAANRVKDEFLATISHELRTPLHAISTWLQVLKLTPESLARALPALERGVHSLTQLVNDLLDVSRIISGKLKIDARPVELVPIIEAALDVARPAREAKNIRFEVNCPPAASVLGDPDRLQQVVWNLLSNAIKFTPQGGSISVSLDCSDTEARVIVSDNGQGISPEFLPYVFERFRQADSSSERMHGGLGLGLAIVRHLVELHGGAVQAQSAGAGKGATFTVVLPLLPRQILSQQA